MKLSKGLDSCFHRNDGLLGSRRNAKVSKRNRFLCYALIGLWIGMLFVAGCGKKGDPIPPRVRLPAAIADLSAASCVEGIVIKGVKGKRR